MALYLGTIALEKNRWEEDRSATIDVPMYIQKAVEDGFDGVELWGYHYLLASEQEKARIESVGNIEIFNTYVGFNQGITEELRINAQAINRLKPKAIKFNLGKKEKCEEQIKTLREFAALLNPETRLLCECHLYTLMDDPQTAAEIFNQLGERYGAMIHTRTNLGLEYTKKCYEAYGEHICHIHASNFNGNEFLPLWEDKVAEENMRYLLDSGFKGNYTLEFTPGSEGAQMYENALRDMAWMKENGMC